MDNLYEQAAAGIPEAVAKKEEYLRVRREAWRERNKARKEEQLLIRSALRQNVNARAHARQFRQRSRTDMTRLSRFEQETNINFNAGEKIATVYTRDRAVMRKLDALVTEFPDIYRCVSESDMEKCYEMPKSHVSYRKPRKITEAKREQAREQMKKINRGEMY